MGSLRPLIQRAPPFLVAVAIAAACFMYRFNTLGGRLAGFDNDHFIYLVRTIAVLDGERPLRDFPDMALASLWPAPTYSTSAIAQRVLGRSLRAEALLTVGMLSVGAAGLFWIAWQFADAMLPAAVLTLLAVGLRPALYNYPKILPYVLAIGAMLAYARRPTNPRLVALGATIALAALYRHDHGVYLGLAAGLLVLLVDGGIRAPRRLLTLGAICAGALLPGIVYAQMHGGFVTYIRGSLELSRQEAARTTRPGAQFSIDWSVPLVVRRDPPEEPSIRRIAVLWASTLTPDERQHAEAELRLSAPVRRNGDANWSYAIGTSSAEYLATVVHDSRVLDTDGIDRQRFVLTAPAPQRRWRAIEELRRWRIAPGILRRDNAVPWLYWVAWAVVMCALVCSMWPWPPLAFATTGTNVSRPAVQAVCILGLLMLIGLLRTANPSRLADVSVPVTLLGSWLLTVIPRVARRFTPPARCLAIACLVGIVLVSTLAVMVLEDVEHQLRVAGMPAAVGVREQWNTRWRELGALPSTLDGIDEDLQRASSYLRRCTQPTDKLFVGDTLPEVYYFAQRGFAAGQTSYGFNVYSSPASQRSAIERWDRQSVPIALTQSGRRFNDEFSADYALLAAYLRTRYERVGSLRVEAGAVMDVWRDVRRSFTVDAQTGLPCAQVRFAAIQ